MDGRLEAVAPLSGSGRPPDGSLVREGPGADLALTRSRTPWRRCPAEPGRYFPPASGWPGASGLAGETAGPLPLPRGTGNRAMPCPGPGWTSYGTPPGGFRTVPPGEPPGGEVLARMIQPSREALSAMTIQAQAAVTAPHTTSPPASGPGSPPAVPVPGPPARGASRRLAGPCTHGALGRIVNRVKYD